MTGCNAYLDGLLAELDTGYPRCFRKRPLTHLWFLYVLLEFYAGVLILRAGVVLVDKTGRIRLVIDRLVSLVVRNPVAPVVLAVPVCPREHVNFPKAICA